MCWHLVYLGSLKSHELFRNYRHLQILQYIMAGRSLEKSAGTLWKVKNRPWNQDSHHIEKENSEMYNPRCIGWLPIMIHCFWRHMKCAFNIFKKHLQSHWIYILACCFTCFTSRYILFICKYFLEYLMTKISFTSFILNIWYFVDD